MKKKILFTLYNLELGGTEKAFINLVNHLDFDKYDVDLLIQKKEGIFLKNVPDQVKIIDFKYKESTNIFRRIRNKLQLDYYKRKMKNKYDCAICYTSWNYNCADVVVNICENSILWMHADYLEIFKSEEKVKELFDSQKVDKFRKLVFVSEMAKQSFNKVYPNLEEKMTVCHNYIDNEQIIEMANEEIKDTKPDKKVFLNISRHDEEQKFLSRILYASKKLKEDGYDFEVWFVGDGKDTENYRKMIEDNGLEDICILKGAKENPFPYYKIADCHILCSDSEGFGLTNIEAIILNTPVITTDIAGMKDEIYGKFGIVVDKSIEGVYSGMKEFLEDGFEIIKPYSIDEENLEVINNVYKLIEGK